MEHFTPVTASIGGVLIGLSATLLWLANGRIAGISGIVGGLWTTQAGDVAWRIAFVLGLIAAPAVYWMAGGELLPITVSVPLPLIDRRASGPSAENLTDAAAWRSDQVGGRASCPERSMRERRINPHSPDEAAISTVV
jgi:hypothetical protein